MEKRRVLNLGNEQSERIIARRFVEGFIEDARKEYEAAHNLSCAESHGNKSDTPDKPAARRMKSPAKK